MTFDVVNDQNQKVGSVDLRDEIFGDRVNTVVIWESVVHQNASERRGTHATKNRALVSGSGKKPWRQKGTGRARVGEIRNPLWRKGGTVFGPQPRSYDYGLPRKVDRAGLLAALAQKMSEGAIVVIDRFPAETAKTKEVAGLLGRFSIEGKALLVDVTPDERLTRATRNIAGARCLSSGTLTARDVMDARRIILSREAIERLQNVRGPGGDAEAEGDGERA